MEATTRLQVHRVVGRQRAWHQAALFRAGDSPIWQSPSTLRNGLCFEHLVPLIYQSKRNFKFRHRSGNGYWSVASKFAVEFFPQYSNSSSALVFVFEIASVIQLAKMPNLTGPTIFGADPANAFDA